MLSERKKIVRRAMKSRGGKGGPESPSSSLPRSFGSGTGSMPRAGASAFVNRAMMGARQPVSVPQAVGDSLVNSSSPGAFADEVMADKNKIRGLFPGVPENNLPPAPTLRTSARRPLPPVRGFSRVPSLTPRQAAGSLPDIRTGASPSATPGYQYGAMDPGLDARKRAIAEIAMRKYR